VGIVGEAVEAFAGEPDGLGAMGIGGGGGEDEDGANFPNVASGRWSVVTAGSSNAATGNFSAIGGGHGNSVGLDSSFSTIAGGEGNTIASEAWNSTIGGGEINLIETQSDTATIAGGGYNTIRASADSATIAGGDHNEVAAKNATVGGGLQNRAMGEAATVPGGRGNSAQGAYSFAAGRRATAGHAGAFVWADSTDSDLNSSTNDQFTVRASGGVRFFTATNATAGAELAPGSGSWSMLSDRNAKENFIPANGREILEKVAALPLATWNYKAQDKSIRHLGPMAQDFKAAFNLGENHTTITTVDADGVALAAIQGLNQKLEEQLKIKDAHIEALQRRMERLEKLLSHH